MHNITLHNSKTLGLTSDTARSGDYVVLGHGVSLSLFLSSLSSVLASFPCRSF